ncbi:unnamed protein product [Arabis nemorensis]|uniref:Uncharacterized protein n=1 Tax=Arabis nemorensis TaxID=586526 RepID=A0A565B7K5_9BRAS|nr:unnamed protein product [Arabis nemorensis]
MLMQNLEDFEDADEPVTVLTEGLYRRDSTEYNDENQWDLVGNGGATTRSGTLRRNGVIMFNYTQASLAIGPNRFYKRTIRRKGAWQLYTLVHYTTAAINGERPQFTCLMQTATLGDCCLMSSSNKQCISSPNSFFLHPLKTMRNNCLLLRHIVCYSFCDAEQIMAL